jgi:hypothetical protein
MREGDFTAIGLRTGAPTLCLGSRCPRCLHRSQIRAVAAGVPQHVRPDATELRLLAASRTM